MAAPWTMDIIDLDSDRTTDPNIVSGSNLNLVVIIALGSNTGHPDWHGPDAL